MRFVMDTDHISILQHQDGSEFAALSRRMEGTSPGDLAFTVVSFHEQVLGCHGYINRARHRDTIVRGYTILERVLRTYSLAPVLSFDPAAAEWFDRLGTQRVRVGTMDLRIAAIALSRGLILLTRNMGDFGKVPGLATEDWTS